MLVEQDDARLRRDDEAAGRARAHDRRDRAGMSITASSRSRAMSRARAREHVDPGQLAPAREPARPFAVMRQGLGDLLGVHGT